MCFKHTPPINVGLEKILVEIINVAEMVCPFLLELQERETLEMEKQRYPW